MNAKQLVIPEWKNLGMESMTEAELYRHFMYLGETGSGKTASGILPLCRLAFSSDSAFADLPPAGLVMDPKGELGTAISVLPGMDARKRMVRLKSAGEGPVLWQFENVDIGSRDGNGLVQQLLTFADSYQSQKAASHDRFWVDGSSQLIASIMDIDLALKKAGQGNGTDQISRFWRQFYGCLEAASKVGSEALCKDIRDRTLHSERLDASLAASGIRCLEEHHLGYRGANYLHHIFNLIAASTYYGAECLKRETLVLGIFNVVAGSEIYNRFWGVFVAFVEGYHVGGKKVFTHQAAYFRQFAFMAESTYASFQAVFNSLLGEFMDQEFYSRISINPFEPPEDQLSVQEMISQGRIVVYEPARISSVSSCVGRVLKAGFFKALLVPERLNNKNARPFWYIADEFQRVITHDEESGEQSFLDRCRAYRVCCVLATQSLASLRYAFPHEKGHQSINIIISNTGTKLFFRSTDVGTSEALMELIPAPPRPGSPHVVKVRPSSTLQPGECYFVSVNGKAGRGQVTLAVP